jgi:hypothetical protein
MKRSSRVILIELRPLYERHGFIVMLQQSRPLTGFVGFFCRQGCGSHPWCSSLLLIHSSFLIELQPSGYFLHSSILGVNPPLLILRVVHISYNIFNPGYLTSLNQTAKLAIRDLYHIDAGLWI